MVQPPPTLGGIPLRITTLFPWVTLCMAVQVRNLYLDATTVTELERQAGDWHLNKQMNHVVLFEKYLFHMDVKVTHIIHI